MDNLKVSGTYTGLMPIGSPDPLNGVHVFDLMTFSLTEGDLKSSTGGGFSSWFQTIMLKISLAQFNPTNELITIGSPVITLASCGRALPNLNKLKNHSEAMSRVATTIVNNINSAIPAITFPAVAPLEVQATLFLRSIYERF